MESNIIKLDVTATRIGNDSTPDSLSVSISTPVKDNDKSAGDIPYNTELVTYQERRKTPCFSYGDIRRSETKFLLKG